METRQISSYDFSRPNRISQERLRTIQGIFERLCSSWEGVFNGAMKVGDSSVKVNRTLQVTFGEYIRALAKPSTSFVYRVNEGGHLIADFDKRLVYRMLNTLFGAGNEDSAAEEHAAREEAFLTLLQRRTFLSHVVNRLVGEYCEGWHEHVHITPEFQSFQSSPETMDFAGRDDPCLVGEFSVTAGEASGSFTICLPMGVIESFLSVGSDGAVRGRIVRRTVADGGRLYQHLLNSEVGVVCRIPPFKLRYRHLSNLLVGDVIHTGVGFEAGVQVSVYRRTFLRGMPAAVGTVAALRIETPFLDLDSVRTRIPTGDIIMINSEDQEQEERVRRAAMREVPSSLHALRDLEVEVVIEVGRTRMRLADFMQLGPGAVIELDRFAGDPADVMVGNQLVAKAEILKVNEHFGVRITRILDDLRSTEASGETGE